jgi:hypothetical protein
MDWPVNALLESSAAVVALLGAGTSQRVYEDTAIQDTAQPYVVWSTVGGTPENYVGELPGIDQARIQIDCYSKGKGQARDLARAVRDAIEPTAHMIGTPISLYEAETKLYRYILEFDFLVNRPSAETG